MFLVPNISLSIQEKRIALVIGNGSYKSSPLANPVNDANDMATALERCNFTVMKAINATRKEMRRAIREFGEEINKGAVGLFYYAGHGIQVNGENYLVPIGAGVYGEDEVEDECLKVSSVLRKMESAGNRLNIIILDACRNNPFGRSFRSSTLGLAKMDSPTGSILAYATAPGSVAADGTGRNGLYTSKLLKHMLKQGLKIEEFFKQVRIDVRNATGKRQVPWESSSLTGDFYFISERGISVVKRPTVEPERPKIDEVLEAERERLERERQELERLKMEIERKKLEAERKRLDAEKQELASLPPRQLSTAPGIIYDSQTGLEWYVGPDKNTTWHQAKSWVENLTVGGGGWRMPTKRELRPLYKKGVGQNMDPAFKTTGWWVWAGETEGSYLAWGFNFGGGFGGWASRNNSFDSRAFAVRSQVKKW